MKFKVIIKKVFLLSSLLFLIQCNRNSEAKKSEEVEYSVSGDEKIINTDNKHKIDTISGKILFNKNYHIPLRIIENSILKKVNQKNSLLFENAFIINREKIFYTKSINMNFYTFYINDYLYNGFFQDSTNFTFSCTDDSICVFTDYSLVKNSDSLLMKVFGYCVYIDPRDNVIHQYDSIWNLKSIQQNKSELLCISKHKDTIWKICEKKLECDQSSSRIFKKENNNSLIYISNNKIIDSLMNISYDIIDNLQKRIFPNYPIHKQEPEMILTYRLGHKLEGFDIYFVNVKATKGDDSVYFYLLFKGDRVLKVFLSSENEIITDYNIMVDSKNDFQLRFIGKFSEAVDYDDDGILDKLIKGDLIYFYKHKSNSKTTGFSYKILN